MSLPEEFKGQVQSVLRSNPLGIGEFELLQLVKEGMSELMSETPAGLILFRQHFALMHCLYELQLELWETEKRSLTISPLKIVLECFREDQSASVSQIVDTQLRDYYLDWKNFEATDERDVDNLLNSFWQDYARFLQQDDAWEILGLPIGAESSVITKRYRELAAIHHPDKGGDQESFVRIRAAYEVLRSPK